VRPEKEKTRLLFCDAPFCSAAKTRTFAKTGSGQAYGKPEKEGRFLPGRDASAGAENAFLDNSIDSIQKRSFLPRQARDKHTQSLVVSCRVESLGFPTGEGWRPWAVGGKVAGGVVSYSVPPTAHAAAGSEVEAGAGIEYLLKPTPAN